MPTQNLQLFLRLLTGKMPVQATFVTMRKGEPGKPHYEKKLSDVLYTLQALNRTGSDIYVTVNEMDGEGRRFENVKSVRCVYADYDAGVPAGWALEPSLLVESSPGKAQAYWLLSQRMEPDERWHAAQRGVVWATGADRNVCDAARILRLPFMINHKYPSKPVTKLLHAQDWLYSLEQIEQAWAPVAAPVVQMAAGCAQGPEEAVKAERFKKWLRAAGEPQRSSSGRLPVARNWLFRKCAAGVWDFALPAAIVADVVAEHIAELHYDDALQFSNDAERYGSGIKGSAYVRTERGQVVMQ